MTGASYMDAPAVVDGNLISSPHYKWMGEWNEDRYRCLQGRNFVRMSHVDVVVNKPWGHEYLAYENEHVGLWYLFIKKGERTSLHCHPKKNTGLVLLKGNVKTSFLNGSIEMSSLNKTMIRRGLFSFYSWFGR